MKIELGPLITILFQTANRYNSPIASVVKIEPVGLLKKSDFYIR